MFICNECGCTFEKPVYRKVQVSEFFGFPTEEWQYLSPCCDADYIKTKRCSLCGSYITSKYISTENGLDICNECYVQRDIRYE